ncbi:MAG: DNA (cytosine-5-)-methyltransferase [Opitutaceae bacterium]
MPKTVLEFFAGIGLMREGLARTGWDVVFANDIDPDKQEMYSSHFQDENSHFNLGDIHALNPRTLPNAMLATASFPCNDLSLAGGRAGLRGAQSSAFWGFTRALEGMARRKPPMVLLENVTGFLTSNGGADFLTVLQELNRLGYRVDTFIIDASYFVPQSRQRLFIVGIQNEEPPPALVEEGGFYESEIRPKALADFIFEHSNDVQWDLRNLPPLPELRLTLSDILEPVPANSAEWWSKDRVDYLLGQMSERHLATAEEMMRRGVYSYGTVFRRVRNGRSMAELRTDGIAGCLRTPRGGSGRQILFKAGRGRCQVRLLNGRECARLMGADHYILNVPLNQALFGFGDAVCVPVVEWIAQHYLDAVYEELVPTRHRVPA